MISQGEKFICPLHPSVCYPSDTPASSLGHSISSILSSALNLTSSASSLQPASLRPEAKGKGPGWHDLQNRLPVFSLKSRAGGLRLDAWYWKPETGSLRLVARAWQPEVGGLEVWAWRSEPRGLHLAAWGLSLTRPEADGLSIKDGVWIVSEELVELVKSEFHYV